MAASPRAQEAKRVDRAHVMFFCPTLGEGGADRVVSILLRKLDRRRFAPALTLLRRSGPFVDDIPADVPVHVLSSHRLSVATPELAHLLRTRQPDVVFSTHGAANIIVSLAHLIARSSARLVVSERSALRRSDRGFVRSRIEIPAKRFTYRRADLVTAVSEGVAQDLARTLNLPRTRIRVVHNPMVDDEISLLASEPVSDAWFAPNSDVPLVLAVGRLVEIKDYPTLLDAFERIVQTRPARLMVLGDGPQRQMLESQIAARGLSACVRLAGFVKNPFKYMARARVLLHASRAEGLPGVLIQAMACGTPVVSTDCDFGPREVISSPGRNGFLVPVGAADELARCALELLESDNLWRNMSNEAKLAAQRFSLHRSLARYEAALSGEGDPC